jgi:hypothetical protein
VAAAQVYRGAAQAYQLVVLLYRLAVPLLAQMYRLAVMLRDLWLWAAMLLPWQRVFLSTMAGRQAHCCR